MTRLLSLTTIALIFVYASEGNSSHEKWVTLMMMLIYKS